MNMDFSNALNCLKQGDRLRRVGWNGTGMYVHMQVPDEHSKMRRPYFYICPVGGELVPWVPSVSDILANDWEILL